MKLILSVFIIMLGCYASSAMAYIDPASGSAIVSAIIGFFVAITIVIKTYWYKLKSLFTRNKQKKEKDSNQKNIAEL